MILLIALLSILPVSLSSTPCQNDPGYASKCPGWRTYCIGSRWSLFMEVFCPVTCSDCKECTCEDNPAYDDRCPGWRRHCSSSNKNTRQFVQQRCPSTCNQCSCCVDRLDKNSYCENWKESGYCDTGPYVAWMFNNCYKTCTCAFVRSFSLSSLAQGPIKNVAIVGGGQMGSGIAQVSAAVGQTVVVVDLDQATLDNSRKVITSSLARVAKKKHKDDAAAASKMVDDIVGRISWTKFAEEAAATSDLVVEAIVENLEIKKTLFAKIDAAAPPNTILASNTSSLSIGDIAAATNRKDKFVGLHFFNPVPVMKLLEVVKTDLTDPDVFSAVTSWGQEIGKTTVPCKDTPGFVVNRLLVPFLFEAVRMVERGDATPQDVDVAMKLGAGHPMGPFELFDYIGHDTMDLIMQGWSGRYPDETLFRRSEAVKKLVAEGKLGRKTGEGFYKY